MSDTPRAPLPGNEMASSRYQDYVIRAGKFIGRFEDMYRNSAEIPWHQDETANAIFSDLTVAILRRRDVLSLLDVGCGLGYMAERLRCEIPGLEQVFGLDISETAIRRASEMFPQIRFLAGTLDSLGEDARFDAVVSKDVLWYVLDNVAGYLGRLVQHSSRWVYLGQSFPESRPFYGDDRFPNGDALLEYLAELGHRVVYSIVERDAAYGGREYVHALIDTTT